jgi:hypothetical protein
MGHAMGYCLPACLPACLPIYICVCVIVIVMQALVYHCRGLTALDLSHCAGVSDSGLSELVQHVGPQLTALDLSGIEGVTSR